MKCITSFKGLSTILLFSAFAVSALPAEAQRRSANKIQPPSDLIRQSSVKKSTSLDNEL